MCPKFCTNSILPYIKTHISKNLLTFLKLCLSFCQKLLALDLKIADLLTKIDLVEDWLMAMALQLQYLFLEEVFHHSPNKEAYIIYQNKQNSTELMNFEFCHELVCQAMQCDCRSPFLWFQQHTVHD